MKELLRRIAALRDKYCIPQTTVGGRLTINALVPLLLLIEVAERIKRNEMFRKGVQTVSAPFAWTASLYRDIFRRDDEGLILEMLLIGGLMMGLTATML
jgi:hypothetical protein